MESAWPRPGIGLEQSLPAAECRSERGSEGRGTPVCLGGAEWKTITSVEQAQARKGASSESHTGCVLAGGPRRYCLEAGGWLSGFKSCTY